MKNKSGILQGLCVGIIWGLGCGIFLISLTIAIITGEIEQQTISYCGGFLLGSSIILIKK